MNSKRNFVLQAVSVLQDNATWEDILGCIYGAAAKTAPAEVYTKATEVFGNAETASYWLLSPHTALGGETPLSLLEGGKTEKVLDALGRIEYGVYG